MKNKKLILILSILMFMSILTSCDVFTSSEGDSDVSPSSQITPVDSRIIGEGNIVPHDDLYLYASVPGKIDQISVAVGDEVQEGEELLVLDGLAQAKAVLLAAELEYEAAQDALDDLHDYADLDSATAWLAWLDARDHYMLAEEEWDDLDKDKYEDDIDNAQEDVVEAEEDLEDAQETFERYEDLDEDNSLRKKYEDELEEAQEDYNEAVRARDELVIELERFEADWLQALHAMEQAQADYEATLDGPDPDKTTVAEARVASALSQVELARKQVEHQAVVAPFSGKIVDINISPNETLDPGKWVILLADFSKLYVETNDLTELEVVSIFLGQETTIAPDALTDIDFSGEVVEISDQSYTKSGDVLYDVRILIENPDPRLRWGMTVEVWFELGE